MRQLVLNVLKKARTKIVYLFLALFLCSFVHNLLAINSVFLIKNEGISFGQKIPFVLIFSLLFCFFSLILFIREQSYGLMMITVGGFINLIDRFKFGFVRDYWNIGGSGIYNNINDWIISFGVILFLTEIVWIKKLR